MERLLINEQVLLGRYKIESYLNEGGMQQVFVANDRAFDRNVALKVPKNTQAERRFDRSARLSAKISHPNVAKTLDYFEEDGKSYLIEELVDGIDLGKFLDGFGPLDPHLASHIFHHLARALAASHRVDVIHRDFKPSNVLVSKDPAAEIVKVTDFGIAKMAEEEINGAVSEGDDSSITGSQTAMGALPYMAPEMINDPKNATTAADIWSLAAVAYRMVAGTPPYGSGLRAVPDILAASPPKFPSIWEQNKQFEPLLTVGLWEIIVDCLVKDPTRRPNADQLVERFHKIGYFNLTRTYGTIAEYPRPETRYGFIHPRAGGDSVFFHRDSFFGESEPEPGTDVVFVAFPGTPRRRAHPVVPLNAS